MLAMNNDPHTLESISELLGKIAEKMGRLLTTATAQKNFMKFRDSRWGKHSVNLRIRIDDFDPEVLDSALPEIKKLHSEFEHLREKERKLLLAQEIARAVTPDSDFSRRPQAL